MEFENLARDRYSVRKLVDKPVEEEKITAILEAARRAPTAVNKQPQRILVLQDARSMERLKQCTTYTFGAPMAMVVCYHKEEAWVRSYDNYNSGVIDASIVGTHLMLAVHNFGLGTTWVGHFDPAVFRRDFQIPEHIEPVVIFPMGYPASDSHPSPKHDKRRPLTETVVYGRF